MTELSGENLEILDLPTASMLEEEALTPHYSFYQPPGSNVSTLVRGMVDPFLQFPKVQNGVEAQAYSPQGGNYHLQPQETLSPPVSTDDFDSNTVDFGLFNKYDDVTGNQRDQNLRRSPGPSSAVRKWPLRRQNHACDTCRSSKKACDLALTPSIGQRYRVVNACTTCRVRGVECTAWWLFDKLAMKQAKHRASITDQRQRYSRMVCNSQPAFGIPIPFSTFETDLGKSFMAQSTYSENFQLYVQCFDMPVTQCLLGGCMPPQYSLGIGAYIPLRSSPQASAYVELANTWIKTCWPAPLSNRADPSPTTPIPHLLSAVCVLDALLFNFKGFRGQCQSMSSRDILITDAYKWVAAATASQFVLKNVKHLDEESGKTIDEVQMRSLQDRAYATWCKARDVLFRCIAATKSFRLATSLVLFGLIDMGSNSSDDGQSLEEESLYALCEGLRRLQSLNKHARSRLEASKGMAEFQVMAESLGYDPLHDLSSNDRNNLLELIGAMEWMVSLVNSTMIGSSKGRICPIPLENRAAEVGRTQNGNCSENKESGASCETEIQELIWTRTKDDFTSTILCQELGDDDIITCLLRQAGSILIALWKSLARFTMGVKALDYGLISQWYTTTTTLIDLWRSLFGSLGPSSKLTFHTSGCRRIVALYSNDADVAILLFYEAVQNLEARLSIQSSNPAEKELAYTLRTASSNHKEQRLVSAIMISVILASYNDTFSTEHSTSAVVTDSIAVHPLPRIVVQAHTLAAEVFLDEMYDVFACSVDTERSKEMAAGLETCLNGLDKLRETLICSPNPTSGSTLVPGI